MSMIYHAEDGDLNDLVGKTVGIIGYGEMGQAFALNLRDSGVNVLVSPHDAASSTIAEGHHIPLASAAEVTRRAQVLVLALPDEGMPAVYFESVSPYLGRGHTLIFASAYNVTFGYIEPPPFVDVGLVSPRTTGLSLRQRTVDMSENAKGVDGKGVDGKGVQSFVAVAQDASRATWKTVLAVARGAGALSGGAVEINFEQEAQLSLFVQQALVPVFHHLMMTAAALLMRSGYPAEAALPDLYLSGKFQDYLEQAEKNGLLVALQKATLTGQYATLSRLARFNDLKLERLLEVTLDEIREGDFAREWSREYQDGCPRLNKLMKTQEALDMWDWEQQTLDLFGRAE